MTKKYILMLVVFMTVSGCCIAQVDYMQSTKAPGTNGIWVEKGLPVRVGNGYIVYKHDTVKGEVYLTAQDVTVEKPLDKKHNFVCCFRLNDLKLKTVMMYNAADKKPLCLMRVKPDDKKMLRVVHEGKLNIYDGRIDYIYTPSDIDKNYLVIAYDDVVDDLSSFLTENTKRDLIGYVNDIYGLNINPRSITWKELLAQVDMLD